MIKHILYLILTTLLRLMLSFALHVVVLSKRGSRTPPTAPVCTWGLTMPTRAQLSVLVCGLLAGYVIGQRRRRIVYIEKRHWSDLCKKK